MIASICTQCVRAARPLDPAQDQLGRDGMVGGEDGLADFCEFGMRSTRRRRDRPPRRDSAPGSRRAHRWRQSRRGGGSAKKNRTPARQAAMPACLSWVLSLSKDLPRPRCERQRGLGDHPCWAFGETVRIRRRIPAIAPGRRSG